MQATRFWATAFLAVVVAAGSPGCDHDEPPSRQSCANCGGAGGNPEGLGGAASAGEDSSPAGSSTLPNGGVAAAANGGGAAGVDSPFGGSAGVGAGGEGGAVIGHNGEQLDICVRLAQAPLNATAVDMAYTKAVTLDCRVKWVMPRGQDLPVFQNQVLRFNYAFWGCPQWAPVETFGLVFGTPALSQGDVDLLIDHYLTAAQDTLDLSPLERETMQAALVRLSRPLIMDASLEPSQSRCLVNLGGAGGAGGADAGGADTGGAAGAGGAAANSAGGAL
jgi:hypothetical protein